MQSPANPSLAGPEISLEDAQDAMRQISGYLDISVADFRALYGLARDHALERTFAHIRAGTLMCTHISPLRAEISLVRAAQMMAEQQLKALPVVDADGRVVGILTATDFLRQLKVTGFLELMLRLMDDPSDFGQCCQETPVSVAMTQPVQSISEQAGFAAITAAFRDCPGRSLPVVDQDGKLRGLLLRKQFVAACDLRSAP